MGYWLLAIGYGNKRFGRIAIITYTLCYFPYAAYIRSDLIFDRQGICPKGQLLFSNAELLYPAFRTALFSILKSGMSYPLLTQIPDVSDNAACVHRMNMMKITEITEQCQEINQVRGQGLEVMGKGLSIRSACFNQSADHFAKHLATLIRVTKNC